MNARDDLTFARDRVARLLEQLERRAAGDDSASLDISPLHDELDAIAFGIKVLADELRWAHGQMTESERVNFAIAFHFNPCAMAIVRLSDNRYRDVNQGFERQTGYDRDEVIDRTREEVGLWVDASESAAISAEVRAGRRVVNREIRVRTKSGAIATALYSADIILFRGESCILSASVDVSERMRAEEAAATLRWELAHRSRVVMLDALTASLAHEINQPLTAVMSNAHVALELVKGPSPQLDLLREILEDVLVDSRRAGDVIWRMRLLLKKGETRVEPLNLNAILDAVMKLVESHVITRRIALVTERAPIDGHVLGDSVQVQQVALNLLMNAFDAVQDCEPGRRRVTLRTSQRNDTAVIEVVDCGVGLNDDVLRRVFEPFQTTKREGIGLGLWICHEIVSAHGGTLGAMRNTAGGMTFTAAFPLRAAEGASQPLVTSRNETRPS